MNIHELSLHNERELWHQELRSFEYRISSWFRELKLVLNMTINVTTAVVGLQVMSINSWKLVGEV